MFVYRSAPRAPLALHSRVSFALSSSTALSMAAIAALSATASQGAAAQTQLDPIVVTGTREPQPLSRITADVVVIDAERIRTTAADSIEDLLRREAGVQISRTGGPGQAASVFMRGAGSSNTVVLIDGVRVGSSTLGQVEFESIGLSQIERIEVLRGPGSSLYGADAVGGVVQIFTRRGQAGLRLAAHAAVGGYGSRQGEVSISGAQDAFDYSAALGYDESKGVSALRPNDQFGNYNPDRDGYTRKTGQLNLGYSPAVGHRIGLKLIESKLNQQYDSSEFGGPPDYAQDATPDFRNHLDNTIVALDYRGQVTADWATTVLLAHNDDDSKTGGTTLARYRTKRDQATWQNGWKFSPDQGIVVAYEYLDEKASTDGFAAGVARHNNALVLGYSGTFGVHSLQADIRHDDNSVYGGNTTGRLGWSMEVLPGLRARALAGTTFRAPSFNDLFYPGYGIESIRPEKGRSIEVGLDWRSGDTQAGATLYRNQVRNLIAYQSDASLCPAGYFGCASNIGRARLQGATLSASQRWGALSLRGTVDFLDAIDSDTGARLPRRAAHQETLTGDYAVGAWTLGASVVGVGARPDGGATLGSYATLDLTARWRAAPQWQVEARLLNATDRDIQPARDYRALGRQAWIGLRFDGRGI